MSAPLKNPPGTYFQGGEKAHRVPYQEGKIISSVDPETRALIYRQTMRVRANFWSAMPWGSAGPKGSYLVEETTPESVGTGLVEWDRIFWTTPPYRLEFETCAFAYQYKQGSDLGEITRTVKAQVLYTYFHTLNPLVDITCLHAFRYFKIGELVYYVGVRPNPDNILLLAEDETFERIKAHFYRKKSKYVPAVSKALVGP